MKCAFHYGRRIFLAAVLLWNYCMTSDNLYIGFTAVPGAALLRKFFVPGMNDFDRFN
jgi:hypothetical protein